MDSIRIRIVGNRNGKDTSKRTDDLVKLSLEGRWIALANRWLRDNCPCSVSDYMAAVTPLMPTHIMQGKYRKSQRGCAQLALLKAVDARQVSINDETIEINKMRCSSSKTNIWRTIAFESPGEIVDLSECYRRHNLSKHDRNAFRAWVDRHLIKISKARDAGKYLKQFKPLEPRQSC